MEYILVELENKLIEIIEPNLNDSEYLANLSKEDRQEIIGYEQSGTFQLKQYSNPIKSMIRQIDLSIGSKGNDIDISFLNCLETIIFDSGSKLLFVDTDLSVFKNYSKITSKYIKYQVGDVFHFSTYLCIKVNSNSSYQLVIYESKVVQINIPYEPVVKYCSPDDNQISISENEEIKTIINLQVPSNNFRFVSSSELMKRLIPTIVSVTLTLLLLKYQSRGLYVYIGIVTTIITLIITVVDFVSKKVTYRKQIKEYNIEFDNYVRAKKLSIIKEYKQESEWLKLLYPNLEQIIQNIEHGEYYNKSDMENIKVRIGSGSQTSSYQINSKVNEHKVKLSLEEMRLLDLKQTYAHIEDAPITCELSAQIGIVGFTKLTHKVLVSILFQLAYFYSSNSIKLIVIIDSSEVCMYYHFTHLNHLRLDNGVYTLVYDHTSLQLVSDGIKLDTTNNYIIIQNCQVNNIGNLLINKLSKNNVLSTIYYTEDISILPKGVSIQIVVKNKSYGQVKRADGRVENANLDKCPSYLVMKTAIQKLCILDNNVRQKEQERLPNKITFFELHEIIDSRELDIEVRWKHNRPSETLFALIGKTAKGDLLLDINEHQDGPHGIIAGTTGSGKSELLKTFILSLSVNYSPDYIGFVLIDYKGGAMANQFKELPHILGSTSNLDESEANRIIVSINSEIKSRQNTFKALNISHIDEYHNLYEVSDSMISIPRLIIICDEFAELKTSNPEFITSLVSIARVGRSLGIHLILSTQKVGAVVDSQIISNCNFKIALKVSDKIDSRELIGSGIAADIVDKGRGYLVNANNQEQCFQSGYVACLAEMKSNKRLELIDKYGRSKSLVNSNEASNCSSQIEAVIEEIGSCVNNKLSYVSKPIWQNPLASVIEIPKATLDQFKAQVGVVDIPSKQKQELFDFDIRNSGAIAILGMAASGKTNTLQTILLSLATSTDSKLLKYYVLDKGKGSLSKLGKINHCAEYISLFDMESIKLLCGNVAREIESRRKQVQKMQRIIVAIDDYDLISSDSIELMELIRIILNQGNDVGINLIITCNKYGSIKLEHQSKLSLIIHHYTTDKYDLINAFGIKPKIEFKRVVGRGVINKDGLNYMQVYNCDNVQEQLISKINMKYPYQNKAMTRMPKRVIYKEEYSKQNSIFIGLNEVGIEPCYIDFKSTLIYGAKGKTSFIQLLLKQLDCKGIIIDDESDVLKGEQIGAEYYGSNQFEAFISKLNKLANDSLNDDKYVIYINQSHGFNTSSHRLQKQCVDALLMLIKQSVMIIFETSNCFENNILMNIAKKFEQKIYFGDPHNQNLVRFSLNTKPRLNDDAFLIIEDIVEVKLISIEKTPIF